MVDFQTVEARPAMVVFRVTPRERARLEKEAKARGVSLSELTRRALGLFLQQRGGKQENERRA